MASFNVAILRLPWFLPDGMRPAGVYPGARAALRDRPVRCLLNLSGLQCTVKTMITSLQSSILMTVRIVRQEGRCLQRPFEVVMGFKDAGDCVPPQDWSSRPRMSLMTASRI
jgi:hypothetical protein